MSNTPNKRRVRPVGPSPAAAEPEAAPSPPATEPREPTVLRPDEGSGSEGGRSWTLDVAGRDLGVLMVELKDDIGYWVQKGRYNKLRVLRNGKAVLPDIPMGAVLALEAASMVWAGALRTAIVNVAGRLLFKVELINDAQEHLAAARRHYDAGDLDEAEAEAVKALKVDSRLPGAFLQLGITAKVRGKRDEALRHFRSAKDLDPHGSVGRDADAQARKLDPNFGGPTVDKA